MAESLNEEEEKMMSTPGFPKPIFRLYLDMMRKEQLDILYAIDLIMKQKVSDG